LRYLDEIRSAVEEQRIIGGVPWMPWNNPYFRYDIGGPAHPSRYFHAPQASLGLPALYAGTKILGDYAASLPLQVFQKYTNKNGSPARALYTGPSMLDNPSLTGTQFDWVFAGVVSAVLQGNAWGYISSKDGYGYPKSIEWIPPEDVFVQEAYDMRSMNPLDAKVYVRGTEMHWYGAESEIFHVTGFKLPGRLEGVSLLMHCAETIQAGMMAQEYGNGFFRGGGFPTGVFQNAEIEINAEQAGEVRQDLVRTLRGHQPLVLGRDWDYKPVSVPPSEAQFIEAMQLNATQIAAMLQLPPGMLGGMSGDTLHYSSQAQDVLQIIAALRPWLVRFEQAFSMCVPNNREARFNTDALLKTDLQTRMQIYQIQRNIGFRTADELRALEDLPPLKGGIGEEGLPQELMVALGTRAGAIPKSLLNAVVLEMDVATDRLIKLEKNYISQGKLPTMLTPSPSPAGSSGGSSNGSGGSVGSSGGGSPSSGPVSAANSYPAPPPGTAPIGRPNAPLPLAQDPASFLASLISVQRDGTQPYEIREQARRSVAEIMVRWERMKADIGNDEYMTDTDRQAPWIRSRVDLDFTEGE
jgi:HK97 family phage portal protein